MSRPRALRDSPRCVAFSAVRGLRFGWSPIRCRASASTLRSEPRLPSDRTLRGSRSSRLLRPPLSSLPDGLSPSVAAVPPPTHTLSSSLSSPAGWGDVLGAAERAGRWNPRFGAIRRHRDALAGRGSGALRTGGKRAVHSTRPSCGAYEISRPRQHGPPV